MFDTRSSGLDRFREGVKAASAGLQTDPHDERVSEDRAAMAVAMEAGCRYRIRGLRTEAALEPKLAHRVNRIRGVRSRSAVRPDRCKLGARSAERGATLTQHLVKPQFGPVQEVLVAVEEAHRALVTAAREVEVQLSQLSDETWGIQAKRVQVDVEGRKQPLGEVINQCATIERLLDALRWIDDQFAGATILECHPTTSDGANDLVARTTTGDILRFEVSDVIDPRDSNRKEDKDLRSLRESMSGSPGIQRSFLVVSDTLGKQILEREQRGKAKRRDRAKSYVKTHSCESGTFIIEVSFASGPGDRDVTEPLGSSPPSVATSESTQERP